MQFSIRTYHYRFYWILLHCMWASGLDGHLFSVSFSSLQLGMYTVRFNVLIFFGVATLTYVCVCLKFLRDAVGGWTSEKVFGLCCDTIYASFSILSHLRWISLQ